MVVTPLLLGHRGARAVKAVSENTLSSFELALEHGCDGFEFDVRRTADERCLVCHDATIGKLTVSEVNSTQLPHCPLLEDVLQHFGQRAVLDIELKVPGLEVMVLRALRDFPPHREYIVSSFLPDVVMELKARSATVPVGIICDSATRIARVSRLPVEYVIVEHELISEELISQVHAAHRKLFAWTVNHPDRMERIAGWGADGIIADDTELLVQTLRRKSDSTS